MAKVINHSFHGVLEPVQKDVLPELSTFALEGIEFVVMITALFFIFKAFKNRYVINSFRKFPEPVKEPKQRQEKAGIHIKRPGVL